MNPTIERWFKKGRNYEDGCRLYLKYGDDEFLKELFLARETSFNRSKLEKELRRISDATPDLPVKERFKVETAKQYDELPENVRELEKKKDLLFKEMRHLHSQMEHYKTDAERKKPTFRILELEEQIKSIWEKLDYYAEHKKLPDDEPKSEGKQFSIAEAFKRRNTLRTYLSRNSASPKTEKWKEELKRMQNVLDSAEQALKSA